MTTRNRAIGLAVMLMVCGCAEDQTAGDRWVSETTVEGDTRVVRTLGGGVWGGKARLVEEASIGTPDGEGPSLLGNVTSLWYHEGRTYLADGAVPVARVYDRDGTHLFDIGRRGAGPGEFENPLSVRVHPKDGRIFIRDDVHRRINVHAPDGAFLDSWELPTASRMTSYQMFFTTEGTLYTYAWFEYDPVRQKRAVGYTSVDPSQAEADSIRFPEFDFQPWSITRPGSNGMPVQIGVPFSPARAWAVSMGRHVVAGVSTDYIFIVYHPDGTRTRIEREADRVPVEPDEARWYRARATALMRRSSPGWVWNGPAVPSFKPPFQSFWCGTADRVWVLREGPGIRIEGCDPDPDDYEGFQRSPCWKQTWLLDVFDLQGRYLGEAEVPEGLRTYPVPYIGEEVLVGLILDQDGVPRVKRYRIVLPGKD